MISSSEQNVWGVSQLTHYIKTFLEEDPILQDVEVQGEVANITYHRSGHVYFTLKDADSQVSAVLFKMHALRVERMKTGDKIIARGNISVYAPRGNYQLLVKHVRKQGTGDLFQQFIALRDRLKEEGLFDPSHKRPIPSFARTIGVITSPTGAAIRDIIQTLSRRFPVLNIRVFPAIVQGERGVQSIVKAIAMAEQQQVDLILLGRGGGSMEDLWNFNEEQVARAVFESPIPIITGIGHESDFTIADFVADVRASTPTAAAERAVPDMSVLQQQLHTYQHQLTKSLSHFIDIRRQILDDYSHRIITSGRERLNKHRHEINLIRKELEGMDVKRILQQGYTLTLKEGKVQKGIAGLKEEEVIETIFEEGRVVSQINEIQSSPQIP